MGFTGNFVPSCKKAQINFFKNEKGQISHLVLHQDGENSIGLKRY